MRGVHRITRTGIVNVIAMLLRQGTVVGEIIDPLKRERRAQFVAFRRVVIDHIEDHFDTGIMKGAYHIAHALNAFRTVITRSRGKEAQGVITPEIFQPLVQKVLIIRKPVDGQQFNRGDAEIFDVIHRRLVAHAFKGAAQFLRQGGVELGKALHMRFIDNRTGPGNGRAMLVLPVKLIGVDHPAFGHIRAAVAGIKRQIFIFM